jgi:hypothetical protein
MQGHDETVLTDLIQLSMRESGKISFFGLSGFLSYAAARRREKLNNPRAETRSWVDGRISRKDAKFVL